MSFSVWVVFPSLFWFVSQLLADCNVNEQPIFCHSQCLFWVFRSWRRNWRWNLCWKEEFGEASFWLVMYWAMYKPVEPLAYCSASCSEMKNFFLYYLKQWPGINLLKLIFSVYIYLVILENYLYSSFPPHNFFFFFVSQI